MPESEIGVPFEEKLKLNLRENIQTELEIKKEELATLLAQERGNEFGTQESVEYIDQLKKSINKLENELKELGKS